VVSSLGRGMAIFIAASLSLAACTSLGPGVGVDRQQTPGAAPAPNAEGANPPQASAAVGLDVGQSAPAFVVAGLDGRQISDGDLRAQGKPYILYFYATW
jgi:hypothetical protein